MTYSSTTNQQHNHAASPSIEHKRVLVVDDSLVNRSVIRRTLMREPMVRVCGEAANGQQAIDIVKTTHVDIVLLDIEMPIMDGMTALPDLLKANKNLVIIMVSTLTLRNADITIKALNLGAKDYIAKPTGLGNGDGREEFEQSLLTVIRGFCGVLDDKNQNTEVKTNNLKLLPPKTTKANAVVIGSSTGGPQALLDLLKDAKNITQPIFITQHMPPMFTSMLAGHIANISGKVAVEAQDGMIVENNTIYVAPGDYHMTVVQKNNTKVIALNKEPPEHFCRPSVNPLFRSAAKAYSGNILGVMLTGMGSDGIEGAKELVDMGGTMIAQDQATSVVWGMPAAVAQAGICSAILPLNQLYYKIKEFVG